VNTITIGIGDLQVSNDPNGVLVTYALGSCIAVLVHDPVRRIAGMIHYMLPSSSITPEKSRSRPGMFADTGIPLLFQRMYSYSCTKSDLVVKVVGGATIHDDKGTFNIGKRNYQMLRKMFWKVGVPIRAEAVGGCVSRTARLFVADGRAVIRPSDSFREVDL
jgi:chemotaxis protein CheD